MNQYAYLNNETTKLNLSDRILNDLLEEYMSLAVEYFTTHNFKLPENETARKRTEKKLKETQPEDNEKTWYLYNKKELSNFCSKLRKNNVDLNKIYCGKLYSQDVENVENSKNDHIHKDFLCYEVSFKELYELAPKSFFSNKNEQINLTIIL